MDDLSSHLVREEERVFSEAVVEHEDVAERGKGHVEEPPSNRCDGEQAEKLPQKTLLWPGRRVHVRRQEITVTHV